jgi:hypothetical protein
MGQCLSGAPENGSLTYSRRPGNSARVCEYRQQRWLNTSRKIVKVYRWRHRLAIHPLLRLASIFSHFVHLTILEISILQRTLFVKFVAVNLLNSFDIEKFICNFFEIYTQYK